MVALILAGIIVAGGGEDDADETVAAGPTTTTEEPTTERDTTTEATEPATTEAPTTTTTEPPTTTTAPPPVVYEGTGTQVVEITLPDPERAAIATITHTGGRNFAVWELDANLAQVDLLVNTIGNYSGNVLANATPDVTTTSLEITADGAWRVELKPLSAARRFDGGIDGTGDDVVHYTGNPQVMALSHQGQSNFAVWFYAEDGASDLLANEIGVYNATVPVGAGPAILEITADGAWSIAPA
jgi:hypothetical protein